MKINLELILTLKKEWWDKILNGEKTHEYREVKPYWTTRIYYNNIQKVHLILFRLGYTKYYLRAKIKKISIVDGLTTDLKINKPVYDIEFELERGLNNATE